MTVKGLIQDLLNYSLEDDVIICHSDDDISFQQINYIYSDTDIYDNSATKKEFVIINCKENEK